MYIFWTKYRIIKVLINALTIFRCIIILILLHRSQDLLNVKCQKNITSLLFWLVKMTSESEVLIGKKEKLLTLKRGLEKHCNL